MALVELQVGNDGKFLAKPTNMEQPESKYADRAAMFARIEKTKLEEQWDERRARFFQWALENPTDLDMILDELDKYGVLFEHEYNMKEQPDDSAMVG